VHINVDTMIRMCGIEDRWKGREEVRTGKMREARGGFAKRSATYVMVMGCKEMGDLSNPVEHDELLIPHCGSTEE
jgi:hypothetical protein